MKKLTAVIRADKLRKVESALREAGAPGFTYYDVKGHGREIVEKVVSSGPPELEAGPVFIMADILPRVKVEVICDDGDIAKIINAVKQASATGEKGDGIIYIEPIEDIVRILSGEVGKAAL